ncbi:hypothetical protein [Biostraticola tofi]|uniref:hypothetical protein n=1 Tax=Biostraticola tofi TaxID=466109 RepID=UPI00104BD286|nr:hypothetical protein [Biostraticola tofi]
MMQVQQRRADRRRRQSGSQPMQDTCRDQPHRPRGSEKYPHRQQFQHQRQGDDRAIVRDILACTTPENGEKCADFTCSAPILAIPRP